MFLRRDDYLQRIICLLPRSVMIDVTKWISVRLESSVEIVWWL